MEPIRRKRRDFFIESWNLWKRRHAFGDLNVRLVASTIKIEGDNYAAFVIEPTANSKFKDAYQFMLGRDNGQLSGLFMADYSGSCSSKKYCAWIELMNEYVEKAYNDDTLELESLLNKAVELYKRVRDTSEEKYENVKTVKKSATTISKKLTELTNVSSKVALTLRTEYIWDLIIKGKNMNIVAELRPRSALQGYFGTLRVISPRIALGMNVNFGGAVTYEKGLREGSYVKTAEELVKTALSALYHSKPDRIRTVPYNDEEYEASIQKPSIPSTSPQAVTVTIIKGSEAKGLKADQVMVHGSLYQTLLDEQKGKKKVFIFMKITSNTGISGWYQVVSDYQSQLKSRSHIGISLLASSNLNIKNGSGAHISYGTVNYVETNIKIRPRFYRTLINSDEFLYTSYEDIIRDALSELTVITVGHTYNIAGAGNEHLLFDVFYAGYQGACLTKHEEGLYTGIEIVVELVQPPIYIPEPLSVKFEEYSHETTEESDDDTIGETNDKNRWWNI